ncbi:MULTISPECIES: succinylglutamate desuccinylase/aspartoacylase family protein [unclassified Chelatococcus]|uniref:succinylglutamate desuccinylase/aspartoacylase family protein n=1 Tax=unclassified Chelatococcus TaxID=2638111 RepID=UPI001BD1463F|nr:MULTISPECIES: succinylglutamate desuccinylase/aspartoacylase family protein [unclassified Chelatococcus]CAH1654631.1 Succinylglutamate desuccinylase/aspartoacylase [Hyphomicrobiales bacterium]MBS7740275.1 succinylglutamate desuccinylase/aspartoacylase family protein [Chelatococcus sp. HY11]MBX3544895.1 succinylglutamate desuccinylase/aspartoacylase family protein [Chelatococcus sp.]MCO5078484.1 M14 family metallopeptidase [Chelatococcus sp.]CAH1685362.1 Succinylglutamate desuccinylase/aspar
MTYACEQIALKLSNAGVERSLAIHRFGEPGARPKVYIQAGLHAAEVPGMVIVHHLLPMLRRADGDGKIRGEIVVVPAANPIGLGDTVLGVHLGRNSLASGANFNRGFLDLAAAVVSQLEGQLTDDADANVATIRKAMKGTIAAKTPKTELDDLRLKLLGLACDADYVFDMHAEEDALFAAVMAPWTVEHREKLVSHLDPQLIFYADYPPLFDTACSRPWADLAKHFGTSASIPQACLSVTLELRGSGHVDDDQARQDAANFVTLLTANGSIEGTVAAGKPLVEPIRFEGVEFIRTPVPGIVVYRRLLGDLIEKGEIIAEVVQPFARDLDAVRLEIRSATSGVFFACRHAVVAQADDVVGKVAGEEALADPKHY